MHLGVSNKIFVLICVAAVLLLPAYIICFVSPSFERIILDSKELEARRVAYHLATMYIPTDDDVMAESVRQHLAANDASIRYEFQLMKLKLFAPGGEVVFSSEPKDVGVINTNDYFTRTVAHGNVYTKLVQKDSPSLEGQLVAADVVETYVPVMRNGRFMGAFEIYYDFTATKARLKHTISQIHLVLILIAAALLLAILITAVKAQRSLVYQERVAREKESLIGELREALANVKTLSGFLPICASCKKIRDDSGYWEQIESYIRDHSEAEFSHSICPECAKTLYPDLNIGKMTAAKTPTDNDG